MKKKLSSIILLFISLVGFSQQDSQFTQYMYNTVSINPAYVGSRDVLNINLLHRSQWVGVEGAPVTQTFSIDSPLGNKTGVGLTMFRDAIGPSIETNFSIDFSYTIPFEKVMFAFGMRGGVNYLNIDFGRLNIHNPNDLLLQNNVKKISPVIGAGAYLYTDKWYFGVSSPSLLNTNHYKESTKTKVAERIHFYAIGGYVFDLSNTIQFKPAVLFKVTKGAPFALDISTNFLFNKRFTLGASYRLDASMNALVGFQVSRRLMLGYAYDYDLTDIGKYVKGSHEFFLRYEFFTGVKGKVNPRFF